MKDNGSQYQMVAEKSLFGWWDLLTDYSWELFKYNLWYVLFALPVYLCLLVFLFFNARLFLLAGLVLLIPAGPAILALHDATARIAAGDLRSTLPRFIFMYKQHRSRGIAFSLALGIISLVTLYPVYFMLVTNSGMKIPIMVCAMIAVLILCSLLPSIISLLISGERGNILRKSIVLALSNGKTSFFAGLLQAVWFCLCLLFPYIAIFTILLGMPALIRFTVAYLVTTIQEEE